MPARSQAKIRRDINRLQETIERHAANVPALAAILELVTTTTGRVNSTWQAFQMAATRASKERGERDVAVNTVQSWVQHWRPVVMLQVPGAAENLRVLPSSGNTADDLVRVADDLRKIISEHEGATAFRDAALGSLGEGIAQASKETSEATAARPAESAARSAYTEAALAANEVLVRGSEIVRAVFGPTSPEYKQFIGRGSAAEEAEEATEAATGEEMPSSDLS